MQIGFIGVGLMGGPLARNLIRAGKDVQKVGEKVEEKAEDCKDAKC